ncbi:HdeD family acid-resistance protein, partial [Salmonella enterica subsp. enterica serovar Heidelberg]|nr:HdeD family acid-resistance protein [Salmonella enterica subsp. enterica serovar Heidelberg]
AYALVDGAFALAASLSGMRSGDTPRWWLALTGLAGIAAGLLTIIWPGITVQVLLLLIAAWAIVTGAMEAAGAIALRKEIEGELFLILAGL